MPVRKNSTTVPAEIDFLIWTLTIVGMLYGGKVVLSPCWMMSHNILEFEINVAYPDSKHSKEGKTYPVKPRSYSKTIYPLR
jgi:hypothetical protein